MLSISGYQITAELYTSIQTVVYRGLGGEDLESVIFKSTSAEYPTPAQIARLWHEYEILKTLDLSGVVRAIKLVTSNNRPCLILEDFGGSDLGKFIALQPFELTNFLRMAIAIAETLGQLHQNQIVHKDIKPSNIVLNSDTGQVKIIDFSIASHLSVETQSISNPNSLEGTLAYMSPEQTGRMNRSIDYRTDFYSLGITFYEMLTGQLPFIADDPMELVHCHIAKQPLSPHQVNAEIPKTLSSIVMKLMAKTAEDRYQSAFGLKVDLENCLAQLQATGQISDFPLALQDLSGKLQIPQKLYGREEEVNALLETFDRVSKGTTEIVLIAGYSGIGKSALVNEVHKPIVGQRGYFISGKFDQFKRNIPYAALIQAFQELMQQLLTESPDRIQSWKEKILKALGSNGQALVDVIPDMELIIGEQPPVPSLPPTESQNRFNLVFQEFISIFTKKEHPLVIFLDDLQWADSASLKLMQLLLSNPDSQYLLLIGAYRDNEVDGTHPLIQTLDEIQANSVAVNAIALHPLNINHINQLIADTLSSRTQEVKPLADLMMNKTEGNPFFLNQLLKSLHSENLLTFDFNKRVWQWDIASIQKIGITDNVVDLMLGQIKKIDKNTQDVLKIAACIGNRFDLEVLSIVNEKSISATASDLWYALQVGLILPLNNDYKISMVLVADEVSVEDELFLNPADDQTSSRSLVSSAANSTYKFLHDRVQQAAYALIPEDQKKIVHLKVGQLLMQNTQILEVEENIFDITNHLNIGKELMIESKKYELAQLNLIAGRKAKSAAAYEPAINYLNIGLGLLEAASWQKQYDLTLALYEEAAEVEYLNTYFERSETLADIVLYEAKTLLDKLKVYELKTQVYIAQNQMLKAIDTALPVLEMLGVSLSAVSDNREAIVLPSLEELENIPEMTDPYKLAAMRLLATITACALQAKPDILQPIILTEIQLCLQYGHSALAALAYSWYGILLSGTGDIELAYRAGKLGLKLLEQFNARELKCAVYNMFNVAIVHWKEHGRETLAPLQEAVQSGLENGDVVFAGFCASSYLFHLFLLGESLDLVSKQQVLYINLLLKIKQKISIIYAQITRQATLNLQDLSVDKNLLIGESFDESSMLTPLCQTNNSQMLFGFYVAKMILNYLFKNYSIAVENAFLAIEHAPASSGFITIGTHNFYYSLALLADYHNAESEQQQEYIALVAENQEKMQRWATHAPMNFQHKYELVEAERYRVLGDALTAMEYYDKAIAGAREQGYTQDEAIAYERASEFYRILGREKIARDYMKEAHYAYIRWGATAKVKDLEAEYPYLKTAIAVTSPTTRNTTSSLSRTTSSGSGEALDLSTVMKSSQAISGEIVLDKLLAKLMKILIENAGAQKGFLILSREEKLQIEAKATVDSEEVLVETQALSPENLPLKVINYVERTRTDIVLNNAAVDGQFTADPYIAQQELKSLLCAPILNQGNLIGMVYLENNLTTAAFTTQRLEIVRILSSQAAVSLENALLYQTLEQKVRDRTAQLAEANQEITILNDRLKAENIRMSAELDVTRKLQKMILPTDDELSQIPGLEIAGFMEPAEEVGGDYYDVIQSGNSIKIGIGDVTGHGLESGVLMIMVQTAVRALLENNETDSNKFLDTLNRTIYKNVTRMNSDKNLSLSLLDYEEGILRLSGQHEEAIVVRSGGEIERIDTMNLGFPIGLEADISDFVAQIEIPLNSGDVVVLYTDGITEAEDINGMQYGLDRLTEVISRNWQLSANEIKLAIIDDVREHIGEQKVYDDITMVVLKKK